MKETKTVYYTDELNDEFSGIKRDTIKIDHTYSYIHKEFWWNVCSFFVYRVVMTPVAFIYMKLKFQLKFNNKKVLKECRGQNIFLYGNHTLVPGDGYIPTVLTFPKKDTIIVNADNVSLPGTKMFMEMNGAFPLPNTLSGMKNFMKGMKEKVNTKENIVIYPEAHIWPYYTGIRPFKDQSFAYPIKFSKPVYCFTTTYQQRKCSKRPKITVYVDGPFWGRDGIAIKEAQRELRNKVYETMLARSKNSTYEYIHYRKNVEEILHD